MALPSSEEVSTLALAGTLPRPAARLEKDCPGLNSTWKPVSSTGMIFPQEGSAFEQFGYFPEKQKGNPLLAVPFLQALPGPSASALKELFNLRSAPATSRAG